MVRGVISPLYYLSFLPINEHLKSNICYLIIREGNIVQKLANGKDLTVDTFEKNGFNKPILVAKKEGLGMIIPDNNFSVMDVERCVGMCNFMTCVYETQVITPLQLIL